MRGIFEWALAIVIALFVFFMLDSFVAKSARVYGGSMEATFYHNDRVIVNRLAFLFREPAFGDVIAFPFAGDPSRNYIKRVAGLPGDVIDITNGHIYRNGERLDCEHFAGLGRAFSGNVPFPLVVEENSFFVLGDNLPLSEDSRSMSVGNIHRDDIIGRVGFRWFPLNRFGSVN